MRHKNVRLIAGTFSVPDARDVLLGLLTYKIEFHQRKAFGDQERFGKVDRHSAKRIAELKECRQMLRRFLDEAALRSDTLRMDSVVKIGVVGGRGAPRTASR